MLKGINHKTDVHLSSDCFNFVNNGFQIRLIRDKKNKKIKKVVLRFLPLILDNWNHILCRYKRNQK
jgi:hypothetical protein